MECMGKKKEERVICMYRDKKMMLFAVVLIGMVALLFTGCASSDDGAEVTTVRMADVTWDSARLNNAIVKTVLENGFDGYEVELIPGSTVNTVEALKMGDIDIIMELWTSNFPEYQDWVDDGELIQASTVLANNNEGLWVPTYVIEGDPERGIEPMAPDLRTVKDLADYAELFEDPEDPDKGVIVNGPPSWTVPPYVVEKIESYGLDEFYNVRSAGTDTALAASLSGAYEKGEPWVGYYWTPTWISGKYDITLLEDEPYSDELWEDGKRCEFPHTIVTVVENPAFAEAHPEVHAFLSEYDLDSEVCAELLSFMRENEAEIDEAAVYFLNEYQDVWGEWVDQETMDKTLEAIQ